MTESGTEPEINLHVPNHADDCQRFVEWSQHTGWQTDYQQVERGAFAGSLSIGFAGELQINRCIFQRELLIHASPPKGMVSILIPYSSSGSRGKVQGVELGQDEIVLISPGAEGFFRTPQHLRYFVVTVPEPRFQRALEACAPVGRAEILRSSVIPLGRGLYNRILSIVEGLLDHPMVSNPERQDHLIELLANCVRGDHEEVPGPCRLRNRLSYVQRSREYLEDRLSESISLLDVSEAVGVGRRTLELAFREVLDLSPLQYLRSRRLNSIRRELLGNRGDNLQTSIQDVAVRYGFFHQGYFSRDYKEMFGELPSATIRGRQP